MLSQSGEMMQLVSLEPDDSHDLRVASSANFVADEKFIYKLVVSVESQSDFICEVHGRVEELLVRKLHGSIGLDGIECGLGKRWLTHRHL